MLSRRLGSFDHTPGDINNGPLDKMEKSSMTVWESREMKLKISKIVFWSACFC
jgi:hypothetical protein